MSRAALCLRCNQPRMSGQHVCPECHEWEMLQRHKEFQESPAGLLDRVSTLDELKDWIKEHLL